MRVFISLYIFAILFVARLSSADTSADKIPVVQKDPSADPQPPPDALQSASKAQSKPMGSIFHVQEPATDLDPYAPEKKKKADEYFKRGVMLYEGGDYARAAEAFQVAYETLPHPAVLGNIAMCYDSAGKIPEAVTYYRRYFDAPVLSDKNEGMKERLNALSALVSELKISCEQSCEIRVDGITRGQSNSQVVVMPGNHRVEGFINGEVGGSEIVTIEARETKVLTLSTLPSKPTGKVEVIRVLPFPKIPSVDNSSGSVLSGGFWFAGGVTVVSLSLVTAFGTMTLNKKEDYRNSHWTDKNSKERGERYRTITNTMVGLSGASAAAVLLFAISDITDHQKKNRVTVDVAPVTGVGVAVSF